MNPFRERGAVNKKHLFSKTLSLFGSSMSIFVFKKIRLDNQWEKERVKGRLKLRDDKNALSKNWGDLPDENFYLIEVPCFFSFLCFLVEPQDFVDDFNV